MQIETIPQENLAQALALVERVFMQFEAPDYLPEGTKTFRTFLHNPDAVSILVFYGAYVEEQLVGVLATRANSHIALFFVEPCFQRQGVGRAGKGGGKACRCFGGTAEKVLLRAKTAGEIYKRG